MTFRLSSSNKSTDPLKLVFIDFRLAVEKAPQNGETRLSEKNKKTKKVELK